MVKSCPEDILLPISPFSASYIFSVPLLFKIYFILLYLICVGFACTHGCAPCAHSAQGDEKRAADPLELEFESCELPCRCWEQNPDPLEEQHALLSAKPSLQQSIHPLGRFLSLGKCDIPVSFRAEHSTII